MCKEGGQVDIDEGEVGKAVWDDDGHHCVMIAVSIIFNMNMMITF